MTSYLPLKQILLNNKISGQIPTQIGNLKSCKGLALDSNNLKGPIPTEIANLSNLTGLALNNNYLSGPIPTEIGKLKGLRSLFLNNNCLSINSDGIKAIKSLDVYNKGTICPYKAGSFWFAGCTDDYTYNFDNNCIEKGVLKGITKTNCDKCPSCKGKKIETISISSSNLIINYNNGFCK